MKGVNVLVGCRACMQLEVRSGSLPQSQQVCGFRDSDSRHDDETSSGLVAFPSPQLGPQQPEASQGSRRHRVHTHFKEAEQSASGRGERQEWRLVRPAVSHNTVSAITAHGSEPRLLRNEPYPI